MNDKVTVSISGKHWLVEQATADLLERILTEETSITLATPSDVGCYVEGLWGQYAGAHMVERATEFGFDDAEVIALARKHLAAMGPSDKPALTDSERDVLADMVDETEEWLNLHVAPDDYEFGWYDGEFFFQSVDWFDEDASL